MNRQEIQEQINLLNTEKMELESQLSSGDYKVIKCAEAQAAGDPMPYDAEALHADRQMRRDRINAIEAEIAELERLTPDEEVPEITPDEAEG